MNLKILSARAFSALFILSVPSYKAFADVHTLAISCTGDTSGTCAVVGDLDWLDLADASWEGTNMTITPTSATTATYVCRPSNAGEGVIRWYTMPDHPGGEGRKTAKMIPCAAEITP